MDASGADTQSESAGPSEDELKEGVRSLKGFVSNPQFASDVETIIDRVFQETPPGIAWRELADRLTGYFDGDEAAAYVFVMALVSIPELRAPVEHALEGFEPADQALIASAVRRVRAIHGPSVDLAVRGSGFDPDNWSNILFVPMYLPLTSEWRVEATIAKFGGENVKLVGPPASFLRLASLLLDRLSSLDLQAGMYGDAIDEFSESMNRFADKLTASVQAEAEAAPAAAAPADA